MASVHGDRGGRHVSDAISIGALSDLIAAPTGEFQSAFASRSVFATAARGKQDANLEGIKVKLEAWKATLAAHLSQMRDVLEASDEQRADMLRDLSTLIEAVSNKLTVERAQIQVLDRNWRKIVRIARQASRSDGEWAHDLAKRASALIGEWYNQRLRFYYELIALHAEYDPEARGGPKFENADDLLEYLSEPDAA